MLLPWDLAAQNPPPKKVVVDPLAAEAPDLDPTAQSPEGTSRQTGKGVTPLVAPVPFRNTQVGWGLALMLGAIHRFGSDTVSKPSTGMVGGFYTENGSWGLMVVEMARLGGDAWRLRGLGAHMDVRYDFYGRGEDAGNAGRALPLKQVLDFGALSTLRRVVGKFYLGPMFLWMQTSVSLRDSISGALPPTPEDLQQTQLFAPGIQAEVDSRNDDYWPTGGSLGRVNAWFFTKALGGSRAFQRYVATWSLYAPLQGRSLVLATNLNACWAPGDAPFYALCAVGTGKNGLRGYTQGRYRDAVMTTAQTELRFHTSGRLGATAFAGLAAVAPDMGGIFDAQMLLAGGAGLRYQLTRKFPVHLRFDYAWGRDGGLFYFGVAEAF